MFVKRLISFITALGATLAILPAAALAQGMGQPTDKALWLQDAASEQAQRVADFNELLLWIITVISIFVFALMFYVMIKFRAKANPVPSKVSHNSVLEFVWIIIPVFILIGIGFLSLPLLFWQEEVVDTEFAIRVQGNQWNWTYVYPDHDEIEFTSVLIPDDVHANAGLKADAEARLTEFLGHPATLNARLLDTDTRLVIPVDTKIKVLIAASDVLHAWTVPSFGVKMDAVPGRVNETWMKADQVGTFYGQCSELCGKDHAFMPIAVEVMSKEDFATWVEKAKLEYAQAPSRTALGR